jgi:DNA-binding IclR family transcriptional regulator
MKRSHLLQHLRDAPGPLHAHEISRRFDTPREAVYQALVSLEAKKLAKPVIAEISPNRWKSIGWIATPRGQ